MDGQKKASERRWGLKYIGELGVLTHICIPFLRRLNIHWKILILLIIVYKKCWVQF
jgi:hypothetical protein